MFKSVNTKPAIGYDPKLAPTPSHPQQPIPLTSTPMQQAYSHALPALLMESRVPVFHGDVSIDSDRRDCCAV